MLTHVRRVGQRAALYALVRQELFAEVQEQVGATGPFAVDYSQGQIGFTGGQELTGRVHLLASIAVSPASVLWGYAPMFEPYVGPNPLALGVREFGRRHNLPELAQEEAVYSFDPQTDQSDAIVGIAHDIGMAGVEIFGPDYVYYSFPTGSQGSRQVVLVDQLSTPLPELTLTDVMVRLPRLAQSVDDLDWSLGGLATLTGWRLDVSPQNTQRQQDYTVTDKAGDSFSASVTREEQGRITNIGIQGINHP